MLSDVFRLDKAEKQVSGLRKVDRTRRMENTRLRAEADELEVNSAKLSLTLFSFCDIEFSELSFTTNLVPYSSCLRFSC